MLGWYDAIVAAVTELTAGHDLPVRGGEAFDALRGRLEAVIALGPQASLLGAAAAREDLTTEQIVSNAAVLLFGGIETTEGMIANALLHLLEHPDVLAWVGHDRGRLEAAIEESLRLEPAAAVVDRYATADAELRDAQIRKGELVRVSISAANRDPAIFAAPDRFDPGRFERADRSAGRGHLAFAHGPHVCLGSPSGPARGTHRARRAAAPPARAQARSEPAVPDPGSGVPQAADAVRDMGRRSAGRPCAGPPVKTVAGTPIT